MMIGFALFSAIRFGIACTGDKVSLIGYDHTMAMLRLRLHYCPLMSAFITALHSKHLRTRDHQNGQCGKDAFANE